MILHTSWSWSTLIDRGETAERGVSTFIHGWMDVCMSGGQKSQAVLCCDVLMAMSEHFA
jgi:hypothetical protein